ncbi:MAG TPA: hypothetical protein VIJ77_06415 [Candidatus Tumulicola sp.]
MGHTLHFKPQWSRTASLIPRSLRPRLPMALHGKVAPDVVRRGIYVSEFSGTSMFGYKKGNATDPGPICTVPFAVSSPNGIAVDGAGNLMEPDGGTRTIQIGQGPNMCGSLAATVSDPFGQPSDAASADALNGTIAVGNIFDNSGAAGSISVCTVASGCTTNLTNPAMFEVAGVAMDNSGNCWADATDPTGVATLTYFAGCAGAGVQATGFTNTSFGGIDIDASGNLVTIDAFAGGTGAVDVYSGCNPACTLVGGPFALNGEAVFGHLNSKFNNKLATGDFAFGQVDIYRYSPTSLTYAYSFNNGLSASLDVEGAAYNKRSPQ